MAASLDSFGRCSKVRKLLPPRMKVTDAGDMGCVMISRRAAMSHNFITPFCLPWTETNRRPLGLKVRLAALATENNSVKSSKLTSETPSGLGKTRMFRGSIDFTDNRMESNLDSFVKSLDQCTLPVSASQTI